MRRGAPPEPWERPIRSRYARFTPLRAPQRKFWDFGHKKTRTSKKINVTLMHSNTMFICIFLRTEIVLEHRVGRRKTGRHLVHSCALCGNLCHDVHGRARTRMDAHSTDGTGRTGTDGTDTDGRTDGRTDVAGEGGRAGDTGIVGQQRAVCSEGQRVLC